MAHVLLRKVRGKGGREGGRGYRKRKQTNKSMIRPPPCDEEQMFTFCSPPLPSLPPPLPSLPPSLPQVLADELIRDPPAAKLYATLDREGLGNERGREGGREGGADFIF